jgi:hypothetical protein
MINPKNRIYKAFLSALSGINYNGGTLDVVTFLGKGKTPFYIQLGNITTIEEGCKDVFGHECTIDIQIICQYDGNYATPLDGENISDIVTDRLRLTTAGVLAIEDFDMIHISLENSFNDAGLFETERSYRVVSQYRFMLMETGAIAAWILDTGFWNDSGVWKDSSVWID